jgi:peptidoglycan hydrolase CwlO-like protein
MIAESQIKSVREKIDDLLNKIAHGKECITEREKRIVHILINIKHILDT